MRNIPSLIVLATILIGCATPPTVPLAGPPETVSSGTIVDAPPGDYRLVAKKIDAPPVGTVKGVRVVTKALRLQPSKEWAPTIIFCVKQSQSGGEYCLNTYANKDGSRIIAKLMMKEAADAIVQTTRLPFDLAPADYHYLDLVLAEDRLVMIIDDRQFFEHALPGRIDEYWYSCSSIVCSVEVIDPFRRSPASNSDT